MSRLTPQAGTASKMVHKVLSPTASSLSAVDAVGFWTCRVLKEFLHGRDRRTSRSYNASEILNRVLLRSFGFFSVPFQNFPTNTISQTSRRQRFPAVPNRGFCTVRTLVPHEPRASSEFCSQKSSLPPSNLSTAHDLTVGCFQRSASQTLPSMQDKGTENPAGPLPVSAIKPEYKTDFRLGISDQSERPIVRNFDNWNLIWSGSDRRSLRSKRFQPKCSCDPLSVLEMIADSSSSLAFSLDQRLQNVQQKFRKSLSLPDPACQEH